MITFTMWQDMELADLRRELISRDVYTPETAALIALALQGA